MEKKVFIILICLLALKLQAITFKDNLLFASKLSGNQVIPVVATNASGIASLMLNKTRDSITINASFIELSGAPINVSLYSGAEGLNGTSFIDLTTFLDGNKLATKISGAIVTSNIAKLFNEGIYILVTTISNPAGEIRGQIKLEADWQFTADLSGANALPVANGQAYGLGSFGLTLDKSKLSFKIICQDMSGAINSAMLHFGSIGSTGTMAADITSSVNGNIITGSIVPTVNMLDSLFKGKIYLNISTTTYPNGELRSQLINYKGLAFDISATGNQMVPPVSSPGEAVGVVRLTPNLDTLYYDIVAEGLNSTIDYAHLHIGNFGFPYVNTSYQIDFTPTIVGNRIKGKHSGATISSINKNRLLVSNLALIVHTGAHPAGELRGQVVRYAREAYTINLTGNQVVPATGSSAYGSGIVSISRKDEDAHYMWLAGNLSSTATSAKFHKNKIGLNGNQILDLSNIMNVSGTSASANGFWKNTDATPFLPSNAIQMSKDSIYLEISNASFPNGEIRGQVRVGNVSYALGNENVKSNKSEIINIAPNPIRKFVTIRMEKNNSSNTSIEILNIHGKEVYKNVIDAGSQNLNTQIDLSDFVNGIYFIKISNEKNSYIKKIVKL
jgi:hypothetical protein